MSSCLCDRHPFRQKDHGGPCCGVAGGLCVACGAPTGRAANGTPAPDGSKDTNMTTISQASIAAKVAYAGVHAERDDDVGRHARDVLVLAARVEELEAFINNWWVIARDTLEIILELHADPGRPGASCATGCPGRWPCDTHVEADYALRMAR